MPSKSKNKPGFDALLADLSARVDQLEQNDTSLEEALASFEEGVRLVKAAQQILADAEQKVQLLTDQQGEPAPEDLTPKDLE